MDHLNTICPFPDRHRKHLLPEGHHQAEFMNGSFSGSPSF
jgi:hypothetical protein